MNSYIVSRVLRPRVIQRNILDCVGGTDDFGCAFLTVGGPHGQTGEKPAIVILELDEGVRDIAAVFLCFLLC